MKRPEPIQIVKQRRDAALAALIEGVPYIQFMGIGFERRGDELTGILHFDEKLIGNMMLPALHGGATAAFLEVTATITLSWAMIWDDLERGRVGIFRRLYPWVCVCAAHRCGARVGIAPRLRAYFLQGLRETTMSERISFKEMCEKFDVTPRTLRHYEYIELLFPEKEGRTRFYGAREVARMTLILRGRKFGFSLEEIRQWLELYDADPEGRTQMLAWIELADKQLQELTQRRAEVDEAISQLQTLRDNVADTLPD